MFVFGNLFVGANWLLEEFAAKAAPVSLPSYRW